MVTNITLQEAIEGIKGLFIIKSSSGDAFMDGESCVILKPCGGATFLFNKNQYERYEVIERLEKYFKDKNIVDGLCIIDPITVLWTIVRLQKRRGK